MSSQPARLHILCIGQRFPRPDEDSGSVRMTGILQIFRALDHEVTFYSDELYPSTHHTSALAAMGVKTVSGGPLHARLLAGHLGEPDIVILGRADVAALHFATVRTEVPNGRVIFDTVDLHYLRFARQASLTRDRRDSFRALTAKATELSVADSSDLTWVVSEEEKRILTSACSTARISVVSNIHELGPTPRAFAERRDIGFIGGFQHEPNVDAVTYFVEEVMPLLRPQLRIELFVVGSDCPPSIRALEAPDIHVLGHVSDLGPLLSRWRVFVAPLRYGAGVKGKIGQALSFGLPTVTTAIGAEGMKLRHDQEILVANTPQEFVSSISELYENPKKWERLSGRGREYVRNNLSPEIARRQIQLDLARLMAGSASCSDSSPATIPSAPRASSA